MSPYVQYGRLTRARRARFHGNAAAGAGMRRAGAIRDAIDAHQPLRAGFPHSGGMGPRFLPVLAAALALGGCASLLPRGSVDAPSAFRSYADAQAAAEKIVPFRTQTSELPALGFDPQNGRNVTLIPYPEIVAKLAPYSGVPIERLEPGVRECILAQASCRGYQFHFERMDHKREGNFWADFFNVRRQTHVTGWTFDALIVVSNGTVLFRNFAGQPHVERIEKETNPLGPFQPAGEGAGAILVN